LPSYTEAFIVFGWVLICKIANEENKQIVTLCSLEPVNQTLQRFFEIKEVPKVEKSCPVNLERKHICQTTNTRQQDGRYRVHLPFTQNLPLLHQLVNNEAKNESLVQTIVERNLFVDDIATGAESKEAAINLQQKF